MGEAASGLLERARELEQLRERVREARAGAGSLVLIEGPAGMGKTSLLAAARALAREAGVEVLPSRAGLLERELPWNLVRQLFGGVVGTSDQRREELLAGAGALAGPALGLAAGATAGGADDTGALHGLYWLTTTLCERAPLLLAVDDG